MASSLSLAGPAHEVAAEFERLANRLLSETERSVLEHVARGESLWIEGLRPESLALLALSLSQAELRRVLFVSPDFELLLQRQHRFGARATTHLLPESGPLRIPRGPGTIFCSAGSLLNDQLLQGFADDPPGLIFVEQAHAASSLSFEYRPSLQRVADLNRRLGSVTLVGSAAHSPPEVRKSAGTALALHDAPTFVEPLPTFSLQVLQDSSRRSIATLVAPLPRPALILCATPAQADAVYAELHHEQLPCHRYHAGLSAKERAAELLQFALPGRRAILVATSSFGAASGWAGENDGRVPEDFGRGYARGDLRSLVHVGMPSSLEQYGQELCLLKQDDAAETPGYAVTIFSKEHLFLNDALLARKRPCVDTLRSVVAELKGLARGAWLGERTLIQNLGGAERAVRLTLRFLKDSGAVEDSLEAGQLAVRAVSLDALRRAQSELELGFRNLREQDQLREQRLVRFAEDRGCRMVAFQLALGQRVGTTCGLCDVCDSGSRLESGSRWDREPAPRRRAHAESFGTSAELEDEDAEFGAESELDRVSRGGARSRPA